MTRTPAPRPDLTVDRGTRAAPNRWALEARLVVQATCDPSFRQDLLLHTREVVQQLLGAALPRTVAVVVLDEGPRELLMVLPNRVHRALGSLSSAACTTSVAARRWAEQTLRIQQDAAWRREVAADPSVLYQALGHPLHRSALDTTRLTLRTEGPQVIEIVLPHPTRVHLRVGALLRETHLR